MKTTITLLKLSAIVGLFLTLPLQVVLAVDIYVCGTETVTLKYSGGYELQSGDKLIWIKDGDGGEAVETVYNGTPGSADYAVPLAEITAPGSHTYTAHVMSPDPASCSGDVSNTVEIIRLPELTLSLDASLAQYCAEESGTDAGESTITATTTATSLPAEILLEYSWTATKGGAPVDPLTEIGTSEANNPTAQDLTNTFTLTSSEDGVYAFNATVQYAAADANGVTIKGGCSYNSTEPATVTVTPKPGTPTITVE